MHICLENVKGLKRLDFEVPRKGLWLLTAPNGAGKTTLLTALYRIGSSRAFQDYFRTSATHDQLDTFRNARIHYRLGGATVTYRYAGTRWPPTPKRNSHILKKFPFPRVHYIAANAARIEPHGDEIQPTKIKIAPADIRDFLCTVMGDPKWQRLHYVNTRRGKGNEAYLLRESSTRTAHYYSEKNFSLGELCILKLADKITKAPEKSLILIDEIEMALHPQAQIRLLRHLRTLSSFKSLTILFSTHSASLIKNINRQSLVYLQHNGAGNYESIYSVYPATVLGELAFDEEIECDCLIFVEDDDARYLTLAMLGLWHDHESRNKPRCKVIPTGGFAQALKMLDEASIIYPSFVARRTLLDLDVWYNNLVDDAQDPNSTALEVYKRHKQHIGFLPCTPEVGVVEELEKAFASGDRSALTIGRTEVINLSNALQQEKFINANSDKRTDECKTKVKAVATYMAQSSSLNEGEAYRQLYEWYCDRKFGKDIGSLKALLGPLLFKKGTGQ